MRIRAGKMESQSAVGPNLHRHERIRLHYSHFALIFLRDVLFRSFCHFGAELIMKPHDSGWNGHTWHETNPRELKLNTGAPVLHRHCADCGRDFLIDVNSGMSYAVFASAISFYQLDDEVTERWIRETCVGRRSAGDLEDRKRKTAEIFVYDSVPIFGNPPSGAEVSIAASAGAALKPGISVSK